MNTNLFEHRMLKIREEELKVVKEDNYKLLKELIRQQETNRQFLLYIQFLEEKIIDLNNHQSSKISYNLIMRGAYGYRSNFIYRWYK